MTPLELLDLLRPFNRSDDASDDLDESSANLVDLACEADPERCAIDRTVERPTVFPVVDLEQRARLATYRDGRPKRTAYAPVKLARRKVVIVLHQTGVERPESSQRWHLVTAHRAIGPTGRRYRLHPITTRLVAANRVDRSPYHALSIEVGGNFERDDGTGTWYMPAQLGRGRASDAQLAATVAECHALAAEVEAAGAKVVAILPHRITGRGRGGKPNRHGCCGSRVWSGAGEIWAATTGTPTPAPGFALGGVPVPDLWRGQYSDRSLARWRG